MIDLLCKRGRRGMQDELGRASTLSSVSFFEPSRRSVGEKTTIGGLAPKALKKLNGARFTTPAGETV